MWKTGDAWRATKKLSDSRLISTFGVNWWMRMKTVLFSDAQANIFSQTRRTTRVFLFDGMSESRNRAWNIFNATFPFTWDFQHIMATVFYWKLVERLSLSWAFVNGHLLYSPLVGKISDLFSELQTKHHNSMLETISGVKGKLGAPLEVNPKQLWKLGNGSIQAQRVDPNVTGEQFSAFRRAQQRPLKIS